jgi:hypothetical protein
VTPGNATLGIAAAGVCSKRGGSSSCSRGSTEQSLACAALFGVRSALRADQVQHAPGRTRAAHTSAVPFTPLDFALIHNAAKGDKP